MKKKVLSIMAVVLFMSSLFSSTIKEVDCMQYGFEAANAEEIYFGQMSDSEWYDAVDWYISVCQEANANGYTLLSPSFMY